MRPIRTSHGNLMEKTLLFLHKYISKHPKCKYNNDTVQKHTTCVLMKTRHGPKPIRPFDAYFWQRSAMFGIVRYVGSVVTWSLPWRRRRQWRLRTAATRTGDRRTFRRTWIPSTLQPRRRLRSGHNPGRVLGLDCGARECSQQAIVVAAAAEDGGDDDTDGRWNSRPLALMTGTCCRYHQDEASPSRKG